MMQRSEELSLCVTDEEDNAMLLVHPINPEDIYRKQEGRFFVRRGFCFCVCVWISGIYSMYRHDYLMERP